MAGKVILGTDAPDVVIVRFNDEATAFGGIKRAFIKDKGICNNRISSIAFKALEDAGISTHFIGYLNEREMKCRKVEPVHLQVIVRNRLAGTTARLLGAESGTTIPNTVFELRYLCNELGRPMINDHHAVALGIATYEELGKMYAIASKADEVLADLFHKAGIELVDFKLKFGRTPEGELIVSDEISPDNCRLWDESDGRVLDKDRFRHDLSDVTATYREVMERLIKVSEK